MTDVTRKLATIVALDVAGYSARTEADEARTTSEVAALRPIIEAIAAKHGGRVFNTAGDGFMLEFGSSLAAVEAAAELAATCEPQVRVGVHLGDVVVQPNGDLLGHGVNVAARLMAKSDPGGALVSGAVRQSIRGPVAERLQSRGMLKLDKMAETIETFALTSLTANKAETHWLALVFFLRPNRFKVAALGILVLVLTITVTPLRGMLAGAGGPMATSPPALGDKSIAVLPFKNLSSDRNDDIFADGLTEETLNVLAQVNGLKVISRTSSETFKGKSTSLPEIARILGVRYILEGSVRREGDVVRVTAQLIEEPTDTHVWSKTFEPKLEHVFAVQDDIARALAAPLDVELRMSDILHEAPTKNLEAYRAYIQAGALVRTGGTDVSALLSQFRRATLLDPNFAEAHAAAAIQIVNSGWLDPLLGKSALSEARKEQAIAEKLKPDFVGNHLTRGTLALFELRWHEAAAEFPRLLERNAPHSQGCMAMIWLDLRTGHFEEARRYLAEGQGLDPLNRGFDFMKFLMAYDLGDDAQVETMAHLLTWAPKGTAAFAYLLVANNAQARGDHGAAAINFRAYMMARGKNRAVLQPVTNALRSPAAIPQAVAALHDEAARDPHFDIAPFLYLIDPVNAWTDELNARIKRGETISVAFWIGDVWRIIAHGQGNNPKVKSLLRNAGLVDYWKTQTWPDHCRAKGEDDFECN